MYNKLSQPVIERVKSFERRPFPKSLSLLGLSPNFTHREFEEAMCFERSDELRELAHKEWKNEQRPDYDNCNWRWYLSYVSMGNECNNHYKYSVNKKI